MTDFGSAKGAEILKALLRAGWTIKRTTGSHRVLSKPGMSDYVFSFRDSEEVGPRMLARISRATGLRPQDLR